MAEPDNRYHLVYVFERFPTFTQTFCVREILELERQGIRPLIFSLRDTSEEPAQSFPESLRDRVHVLPPQKQLSAQVSGLREAGLLSRKASRTINEWGGQTDKFRIYEASYIGHYICRHAPYLRHAHCHFAGMAARTLWWLHHFYNFTFSFTAHANDVFCPAPSTPVSRANLIRDASRIVTVSDYTVRRLSKEYPGTASRIRKVYNGLDIAPFAAASNNGQPSGIGSHRITSVGRLIEKKGFDDLVRASAFLRDRGVKHTVHIIGDGPLRAGLESQIAAADLGDTVFLEGEKNQQEIIDILAHHTHIFALPCVTEADGGMDNLPTVLMEAMAVGLPCVSTRLAGIPEMIIENETGLLTDERQPGPFAAHLETLLNDESLCHSYGRSGFGLANARFDKAVTTQSLQEALISDGPVRLSPSPLVLTTSHIKQLRLRIATRLSRKPPLP